MIRFKIIVCDAYLAFTIIRFKKFLNNYWQESPLILWNREFFDAHNVIIALLCGIFRDRRVFIFTLLSTFNLLFTIPFFKTARKTISIRVTTRLKKSWTKLDIFTIAIFMKYIFGEFKYILIFSNFFCTGRNNITIFTWFNLFFS